MRLSRLLLATCVVLGPPLHQQVPTAATEPVEISIAASLDAHVRGKRPATSYGTRTAMEVDGDPVRHTYLKFDVSGVAGRQVSRCVSAFTR